MLTITVRGEAPRTHGYLIPLTLTLPQGRGQFRIRNQYVCINFLGNLQRTASCATTNFIPDLIWVGTLCLLGWT